MLVPRIVLATVGSLGDLHPFIAIGMPRRNAAWAVRDVSVGTGGISC